MLSPPNPTTTVAGAKARSVNRSRRSDRYASREFLWSESTLKRVRHCGRYRTGAGDVQVRNVEGTGYYGGLQTCGSIWACPVCSAKIRNTRADEISGSVVRHINAGGGAIFVTLTVPHYAPERLSETFSLVASIFRRSISGAAWVNARERYGVLGTIRAIEVTHGENGWHPHLHVLVILRDPSTADAVSAWFSERWRKVAEGYGRRPDPSIGAVARLVSDPEAVAAYVAKVQDPIGLGAELARSDLKDGRRRSSRTPFAILRSARTTGDVADRDLWREYEAATHGRQAITWSAGLRALLVGAEEVESDEEIASAEVGGDLVGFVDAEAWSVLTRTRGAPAQLLSHLEDGGLLAARRFLRSLGLSGDALRPPDLPPSLRAA